MEKITDSIYGWLNHCNDTTQYKVTSDKVSDSKGNTKMHNREGDSLKHNVYPSFVSIGK